MDIMLNKVFVGLPKTVGIKDAKNPMDREWESAIFKEAVSGPAWVSKTGIIGDGQADLENHGGPDKAVFAYSLEHYTYWQTEYKENGIILGGMGENFLIEHLTEEDVAIGDTYQIGDVLIQVSQPRQPCWKPARRFKLKPMALFIQDTGRTGWYFRVLKEGHVEAGQTFTLIDRPYPKWTITKCNELLHGKTENIEELRELAQCELLAQKLSNTLAERLEKGKPDIQKRVIGPNE